MAHFILIFLAVVYELLKLIPLCLYCEAKTERLRCFLSLWKLFFATEHSWRALEKFICWMIWLLICWWWRFPQLSDMVTKNRWTWSFSSTDYQREKSGHHVTIRKPPSHYFGDWLYSKLVFDFSLQVIFLDNLGRTRNFKFFKILKLNKCFSLYLFIVGTEYHFASS